MDVCSSRGTVTTGSSETLYNNHHGVSEYSTLNSKQSEEEEKSVINFQGQ